MEDIHFELARTLVELATLKKEFKKKPAFAKSLTTCKESILNSYIAATCDVLTCLSLFIRDMEYEPKQEKLISGMDWARNTFNKSFILSERSHKSGKIYYLFNMFREAFENSAFQWAQKEIERYFFQPESEVQNSRLYKRFSIRFFTLVELAVLYLSGFYIKCTSIKDEVFEKGFYKDIYGSNFQKCDSASCNMSNLLKKEGRETLHFFIVPEFLSEEEKLMGYVILGLKNPSEIQVIVDWKLFPPSIFTEDMYNRYAVASQLFHAIKYINCDHINFGKWESKLAIEKPTFRQQALEVIGEGRAKDIPRLGEILLDLEKIDTEDLDAALAIQRIEGGLIGDILSKQGVSDRDIGEALQKQQKLIEDK